MGFQKAERKKVKIKLALIGPSGSGKTYSALRIATGIGGRVGVIDTENRRSEYYATEFDFDVLHLSAPYTPERYIAAIEEAENAGIEILIIDSASHEWIGPGGLLEIHSNMPGNSYANWNKITPRHNNYINKILFSPMHIITNLRGKDQYVLEEKDGKQTPKKVGMGPQMRDNWEYEMTAALMLDQQTHVASAVKDNTHLFDGKYEVLTEEHGKQFITWASGGIEPPQLPELSTDQVTYINDLLQQKGITDLFHANMMKKINVADTKYMTQEQYEKYVAYLEKQPDKEAQAS